MSAIAIELNKTPALRSIKSELPTPADLLEFKDGESGGGKQLQQFTIDIASNGFFLTFHYDDFGDKKEIHPDIESVFASIKKSLK